MDRELEKILQDEENDRIAHAPTAEQIKEDDERNELGKLTLLNTIFNIVKEK